MKKRTWTHKKTKGNWIGLYGFLQNYSKSERVFLLMKDKNTRLLSFESWQEAKKKGWVLK